MENNLKLFKELLTELKFVFQQDNASIYVAHETKTWFSSKNVTVPYWPASNSDLNPIENLLGIMYRKVCANFRPRLPYHNNIRIYIISYTYLHHIIFTSLHRIYIIITYVPYHNMLL